MLNKPLGDDLLSYPRLESPYIWVFQFFLNHIVQFVKSTIVLADSLVELQVEAAQSGAVLEFGLVVDICCSEAVDLDTAYTQSTL